MDANLQYKFPWPNSVFNFLKILILLCVEHLKEKKMISEN